MQQSHASKASGLQPKKGRIMKNMYSTITTQPSAIKRREVFAPTTTLAVWSKPRTRTTTIKVNGRMRRVIPNNGEVLLRGR